MKCPSCGGWMGEVDPKDGARVYWCGCGFDACNNQNSLLYRLARSKAPTGSEDIRLYELPFCFSHEVFWTAGGVEYSARISRKELEEWGMGKEEKGYICPACGTKLAQYREQGFKCPNCFAKFHESVLGGK